MAEPGTSTNTQDIAKRTASATSKLNSDSDDSITIKTEPESDDVDDGKPRVKKFKHKKSHSNKTMKPVAQPLDGKDPLTLWKLFIDDSIITQILMCTNKQIEIIGATYSAKSKGEATPLGEDELYAFIGLLVYTAVFKTNTENVHKLFATDGSAREIFKSVMSRNRFVLLLHTLSFKIPNPDKNEKEDKIGPISLIFNKFVQNCKNNFTVGPVVTLDEQFFYLENHRQSTTRWEKNPMAYEIKLQFLCDAETSYFYDGHLCTENCSKKDIFSNAILQSTSHNDVEPPAHKFEQATNVDEVCRRSVIYSCKRKVQSWQISIFYHLLDISTVNAYILYQESTDEPHHMEDFLKDLGRALVLKHLLTKVDNLKQAHDTRMTIRRILGNDAPPRQAPESNKMVDKTVRWTCRMCHPSKKRKTYYSCLGCKVPICLTCASNICRACAETIIPF